MGGPPDRKARRLDNYGTDLNRPVEISIWAIEETALTMPMPSVEVVKPYTPAVEINTVVDTKEVIPNWVWGTAP